MNYFLMLWPFQILTFLGLTVVLFLFSFSLIMRREKGADFFLWLLFIILIPILGSITYIMKYLTIDKRRV